MTYYCPRDGLTLNGGPIEFWCDDGHAFPAADIIFEREIEFVSDTQILAARRSS
jgi:hypothetical protein